MELISVEARDIPDAWFLLLAKIIKYGHKYTIDRGSYEGTQRLEFDYITIHIKFPGTRPLIPDIPPHLGIPNPVAEGYIESYLPYLMTSEKPDNTCYTYGEFLEPQILEVISMFRRDGHGTNQAYMTIGNPEMINMSDPACLRGIDCRIKDNKLHFMIYFRSWCLWSGLPANLAAIQLLKEYMSSEIGVEDGEIIASSKGLHLYEYAWPLAQTRVKG